MLVCGPHVEMSGTQFVTSLPSEVQSFSIFTGPLLVSCLRTFYLALASEMFLLLSLLYFSSNFLPHTNSLTLFSYKLHLAMCSDK